MNRIESDCICARLETLPGLTTTINVILNRVKYQSNSTEEKKNKSLFFFFCRNKEMKQLSTRLESQ